jgi:hypothetical protein
VYKTYADTTALEKQFGYCPKVRIKEWIEKVIE